MSRKRIILSAGGTGGHLFPAQAVAKELMTSHDVLFVGGGLSQNRFFNRHEFVYKEIPCATFSFSQPFDVMKKTPKLLLGLSRSMKILKEFSPDLIVGFGSYYTLPLLLAATFQRLPFLLHEQNAVPGKVNKLFSKLACETAITFPSSSAYVKGKTEVARYPIRREILDPVSKDDWDYFGLNKSLPVVLIFGGSQGGKGLNRLVLEAMRLLPPKRVQVLHFTGSEQVKKEAVETYAGLNFPHVVKEFEPEIHRALKIADFAITRAGAGTVVELMAAKLPAILIPFPFAAEDHQAKNATHFVGIAKGGSLLIEKEATGESLAAEMTDYLNGMALVKRENLQTYEHKNHDKTLHEIILEHIH